MARIHPYIEQLSELLEVAGAAIILLGVVLATFWFVRAISRGNDGSASYQQFRANLGRGILLGLELLVGADIIRTITAPLTYESVGLLGAVVLIRTFLSFSLETEIQGCWPWQQRAAEAASSQRDRQPD